MQTDYLRDFRYKLQKRIRRLNGCSPSHFLFLAKQFCIFLDSYPLLQGVISELVAQFPDLTKYIDTIFSGQGLVGATEEEDAAIGYGVFRRFAEQDKPLAFFTLGGSRVGTPSESLDEFRAHYLEPFYEYLDERIDDRSFVIWSLVRYKHFCEWFRRQKLFQLWENEKRRGERLLALDLYEYLYERGVDFHIEPWSASGEVDMISSQTSQVPLVADAKIFNPESNHGVDYLKRAFRQIYLYLCDYNQSIGYLVIFNTSNKLLRFSLSVESQPLPRLAFNQKTIFFLTLDIFPHAESASRRPATDAFEITEQAILGEITKTENLSDPGNLSL
jgi:hypothetical protein